MPAPTKTSQAHDVAFDRSRRSSRETLAAALNRMWVRTEICREWRERPATLRRVNLPETISPTAVICCYQNRCGE